MKLCVLGGGGFRTPHVHRALLRVPGDPLVTELVLHDVDAERLRGMEAVLARFAEGVPHAPRVRSTTVLQDAVEGSGAVFAALRVGGTAARCADERVALDLGVLGQETTGPGGIAFALRTVPVVLEAARAVERLAPGAWFVNFTNPAGIVTEAVQGVLGERALGVCDSPSALGRRAAGLLGLDPARVLVDYAGLNHLGWVRRLLHGGVDVLPRLLADDALLARLEEGRIFGADWLRALGCVPNEYLYYYYRGREAVRRIVAAGETRGEELARTQGDFYARLARAGRDGSDPARLWLEAVGARSAGYMAEARGDEDGDDAPEDEDDGYAGVAVGVLGALLRDERRTAVLDVRNGGALPGLPDDAVVEVTAAVDANGVHPLAAAPLELHQLGLVQQVKAVERLALRAAVTGDAGAALRAFALHPLVGSLDVARELLDGYCRRIPEVAAVLGR